MAALSLGSGSRMVIPCQLMEGGGGGNCCLGSATGMVKSLGKMVVKTS